MADVVVKLRRATLGDIDRVVDLRVEFLKDVGQVDDEAVLRAKVTTYLRRTIPTGDCAIWVAETEGTIVATGAMAISERMSWDGTSREGYVLSMYTVPEHRRKGIASAMVDAMLAFAREEDLKLCLIALDDAHGIYERAGFTHDPRYMRWRP